jgi:hypothetical protein
VNDETSESSGGQHLSKKEDVKSPHDRGQTKSASGHLHEEKDIVPYESPTQSPHPQRRRNFKANENGTEPEVNVAQREVEGVHVRAEEHDENYDAVGVENSA